MRDRAKRAAKTTEDRAAGQQQRRERRTSETEEQREVRLQRMHITHSERMAVETEEQNEARLQRMSTNRSDRLAQAAETEEQREARLQRMRANQSERDWLLRLNSRERPGQQKPQLPLLEQPSVQARMRKIHSQFSTLDVPGFPGLKFHSRSTECLPCSQDNHMPKLYSSDNNMNHCRFCWTTAILLSLSPFASSHVLQQHAKLRLAPHRALHDPSISVPLYIRE